MLTKTWSFGDKVVHLERPEWGSGVVTAVAGDSLDGKPCQRLTIRFDRAGVKQLLSAIAHLVPASDVPAVHPSAVGAGVGAGASHSAGHGSSAGSYSSHAHHEDPLKAAVAGPSAKDVMLRLPQDATDPFTTPKTRLLASVRLYRFSEHGGSLLDWACMQSGLKDPMTRFNRHELEDLFRRWAQIRDEHFRKIAAETRRNNPALLAEVMRDAPRSAHTALKRFDGFR